VTNVDLATYVLAQPLLYGSSPHMAFQTVPRRGENRWSIRTVAKDFDVRAIHRAAVNPS
jgi:hypothetical protein